MGRRSTTLLICYHAIARASTTMSNTCGRGGNDAGVRVTVGVGVRVRRARIRASIIGSHGCSGGGAGLSPEAAGLEPAGALVSRLDLVFDHATDAKGTNGGPDAAFAAQDPVVERFTRWRLEQPHEVGRRHRRYQHHARPGHLLVHQEPPDPRWQEPQRIQLPQSVAHF